MSLAPLALTAALQNIGNAKLAIGDPFTASGMAILGAKEGEIKVDLTAEYSDLTAKELTGPAVHQRTVMGVGARVTIPIIMGDTALYAKISPTGTSGGGWSNPQAIVPTSILVIPDSEIAGGIANATGLAAGWVVTTGNGYTGGSGAGYAPVHAFWGWRAVPELSGWGYTYENGGKIIREVVFQLLFDASRPEGHKLWTIGDPTAQGISTLRI
jgi:hypothetical protein